MNKNFTVFLVIVIVCSAMLVAACYSMSYEGHGHAETQKSSIHGYHQKVFDPNNFVMHSFNGMGFLHSSDDQDQNAEDAILNR